MIFCPDSYLWNLEGNTYTWTPERAALAWKKTWEALKEALIWGAEPQRMHIMCGAPGSGKSTWIENNRKSYHFYFDATLDLPYKRRQVAEFLWTYRPACPVTVVWVDTPLEECLLRNERRGADRRVPPSTIQKMHRNLTAVTSPPGVQLVRVRENKPSKERERK
jgi:predicted kinase